MTSLDRRPRNTKTAHLTTTAGANSTSSSMAPRLRVLAGPSPDELVDITELVNTPKAHTITSSLFDGQVVVNVKGLGDGEEGEYFGRKDRKGVTWSIQVQGRFLEPHSSNDILFGNTFERPLQLPWGSGAALSFMKIVDPTLEHDLAGKKPWALSPLISTMPHFAHKRVHHDSGFVESPRTFPPARSIEDDISEIHLASALPSAVPVKKERRSHFSNAQHRKDVVFGPQDVITTDFCYGFLEFTPKLSLRLPGGISFDLMKYWDGQPVRFVCCERLKDEDEGSAGVPWGRTFYCVCIELVLQDE